MALQNFDHKDETSVRTFVLDNNKLYAKRTDPFGFFHVNFDKGQVPESLKGAFTSGAEAEKAILQYLKEKGREPIKKV